MSPRMAVAIQVVMAVILSCIAAVLVATMFGPQTVELVPNTRPIPISTPTPETAPGGRIEF